MKHQVVTIAAMLACGCIAATAAEPPQSSDAADNVVITAPYARAVPPGQPNSAVFMVLENTLDDDYALVSAASAASDVVELHTHRMEDGMMKMRQVPRIDLPGGEQVELKPGGLHVMLIGLKDQLVPGDEVDVTLQFDDGSSTSIIAPVRKIMP